MNLLLFIYTSMCLESVPWLWRRTELLEIWPITSRLLSPAVMEGRIEQNQDADVTNTIAVLTMIYLAILSFR